MKILAKILDFERIITRVSAGIAMPRELLSLKQSLE